MRVPAAGHRWRYLVALGRRTRRIVRLTGQATRRALVGMYTSEDLTHAASIAYYALLSLFPFLLLVVSLLGSVTADMSHRDATLRFVLQYFPARLDFVTRQLDAFRTTRLEIGVLGLVTLTWAALGFFSAVSSAVNYAWKVERQRSYLSHKLVAFVMMTAAAGLLLVTLLVISAGQIVGATWFAAVAGQYPWLLTLRSLTVHYASMTIVIVAVGLVFYFVPSAKVRFRDVWVGAVLTGVLWRLAFAGFTAYVRDLSRFSVHGSIGAVVVFLLWVYISAVILLYGVEFTAAYSRLRRHRPDDAPAAPRLGS